MKKLIASFNTACPEGVEMLKTFLANDIVILEVITSSCATQYTPFHFITIVYWEKQ